VGKEGRRRTSEEDTPALNWKRESVMRLDGSKADIYYHAPCGSKIRSMPEARRYLDAERGEGNDPPMCTATGRPLGEGDFCFKGPPTDPTRARAPPPKKALCVKKTDRTTKKRNDGEMRGGGGGEGGGGVGVTAMLAAGN